MFESSFTNYVVVCSNPVAVTYTSDIMPFSSKEFQVSCSDSPWSDNAYKSA